MGCWGSVRAADAHDVGRVWGVEEASAQLMLICLPGLAGWGRVSAADAHDAGQVWGVGEVRAADAHDAGRVWGVWDGPGQLMLMLLAELSADAHDAGRVLGFRGESGRLMPMLAGIGRVGKSRCR